MKTTKPKLKPASHGLNIKYHDIYTHTWIVKSITSLINKATGVNPTVYSPLKSSHQGLENTEVLTLSAVSSLPGVWSDNNFSVSEATGAMFPCLNF